MDGTAWLSVLLKVRQIEYLFVIAALCLSLKRKKGGKKDAFYSLTSFTYVMPEDKHCYVATSWCILDGLQLTT